MKGDAEMPTIALRSYCVGISVLLALVLQGCNPLECESQNLGAMQFAGAKLIMAQVHEEQERERELVVRQTQLRNALRRVTGVHDVSVAIWVTPPDEGGVRIIRFIATAELAPCDEPSAAGIRSQFVSIAKTVLPDTADVAARPAEDWFGQHAIVLNGILCP